MFEILTKMQKKNKQGNGPTIKIQVSIMNKYLNWDWHIACKE